MAFDLHTSLAEHQAVVATLAGMETRLQAAAQLLRETLQAGGKMFACGNGGSAADAQHFAAEFTGRFERERRGYPAIALTTDTSAITSIGNDYGFEHIFARQLEALARPGDVLLAISTSGKSANVVRAVETARASGVRTIGLLGGDGGPLAPLVDIPLIVPARRTSRVQEAHIVILHLLCEAVEQ